MDADRYQLFLSSVEPFDRIVFWSLLGAEFRVGIWLVNQVIDRSETAASQLQASNMTQLKTNLSIACAYSFRAFENKGFRIPAIMHNV